MPNCMIRSVLCSRILLNVLLNPSSTDLLPLQYTRFQTPPMLEAFLATFDVLFWYLWMVPGKPTYWNQVGGNRKRVSCHGNRFFYSRRYVSFRTIRLPSLNISGTNADICKRKQCFYSFMESFCDTKNYGVKICS